MGDEQGWGVINWLVCSDCITPTVGVMGPCGTTLLKPGSILRNSAQLPASGTLPGGVETWLLVECPALWF